MNGPSQLNQPAPPTAPVEPRLPQWACEANRAANTNTSDRPTMPMISVATAVLLSRVTIGVDHTIRLAWTASTKSVHSAALVGV
jgi:hypothetical protein